MLLGIIISTLIANSIIILSDSHKKHSTALWILNIVAITASGLGIVAICRYGIHGVHGKSYLFLTLGLISWLSADFTLLYSYYALNTEEQEMVSTADAFWFAGYGFLSLHLFTILRSLYRSIQLRVAITVAIFCLVFVGYNVHILLSSEGFLVNSDIARFGCYTCLSCFRSDFNLSFCFDTPQLKERLSAINSLVSFFIVVAN